MRQSPYEAVEGEQRGTADCCIHFQHRCVASSPADEAEQCRQQMCALCEDALRALDEAEAAAEPGDAWHVSEPGRMRLQLQRVMVLEPGPGGHVHTRIA